MIDGGDALRRKQLGEQPHHHLAVFEHIAHAAGRAQVVLKHVVGAIAITHQVNPGDMRVDVAVQVKALHRQLILLVGQHLLGRYDASLDDALVVIEVGKKHVQRFYTLDTALLDDPPFTGRDAARDGVERDQPLGTLLVPVKGERDTCTVEQQVGFPPPLSQQLFGRIGKPAGEFSVMRADSAVGIVHLIIIGAAHAVLLVTRTPEPSQGPCHRHKHFRIKTLEITTKYRAPKLCAKRSNAIANASSRSSHLQKT